MFGKGKLEPGQLAKVQRKAELEQARAAGTGWDHGFAPMSSGVESL